MPDNATASSHDKICLRICLEGVLLFPPGTHEIWQREGERLIYSKQMEGTEMLQELRNAALQDTSDKDTMLYEFSASQERLAVFCNKVEQRLGKLAEHWDLSWGNVSQLLKRIYLGSQGQAIGGSKMDIELTLPGTPRVRLVRKGLFRPGLLPWTIETDNEVRGCFSPRISKMVSRMTDHLQFGVLSKLTAGHNWEGLLLSEFPDLLLLLICNMPSKYDFVSDVDFEVGGISEENCSLVFQLRTGPVDLATILVPLVYGVPEGNWSDVKDQLIRLQEAAGRQSWLLDWKQAGQDRKLEAAWVPAGVWGRMLYSESSCLEMLLVDSQAGGGRAILSHDGSHCVVTETWSRNFSHHWFDQLCLDSGEYVVVEDGRPGLKQHEVPSETGL